MWTAKVEEIGTSKLRIISHYNDGNVKFSYGPIEVDKTTDYAKDHAKRAIKALNIYRIQRESEDAKAAVEQALNDPANR